MLCHFWSIFYFKPFKLQKIMHGIIIKMGHGMALWIVKLKTVGKYKWIWIFCFLQIWVSWDLVKIRDVVMEGIGETQTIIQNDGWENVSKLAMPEEEKKGSSWSLALMIEVCLAWKYFHWSIPWFFSLQDNSSWFLEIRRARGMSHITGIWPSKL